MRQDVREPGHTKITELLKSETRAMRDGEDYDIAEKHGVPTCKREGVA